MPTRSRLLVVLAAAALSAAWAKSEEPARQRPASAPVLKGLKAPEWGVFLVGGKTVAGGGGEAPDFVQRVEIPPQQSESPQENLSPAKEPVIHVYVPRSTSPTPLTVTVGFPTGRPELAWPCCKAGWGYLGCPQKDLYPTLTWDLHVGGALDLKQRGVPENHWISAARKVDSDFLVTRDTHEAERFLFYEGKTTVEPQVRIHDLVHPGITTGACVFDSEGPSEAWCVLGGVFFHAMGLQPGKPSRVTGCESKDLEAQLSLALTGAGLSKAEAKALLTIWMPELTKPGTRLVYAMPRTHYDKLLPIDFTPAPEELVRVGLVIQELP